MEALTQLMSLIDLNSKSLPEGDYLEMCNRMKDIYKVVPRPTSPEAALPRIQTRVPFQPRRPFPESDSEEEQNNEGDQITEQINQYAHAIGQANRQLRQRESRLKYLKIKQRVTAAVRKDAVRERAQQLGIRLREYTLEELRAKGHNVSDERSFYRSYLDRSNLITQGIILDIQDEIAEITAYREEQRARRRDAYESVYGRPPP
jgi:hypothetical protein